MGDYRFTSSVSEMIYVLKWPSLEQRRLYSRLTMFYNLLNRAASIDMPQYYHLLTPTHNTRNYHPLHYKVPQSSTTYYQMSYFPKTIRDWNKLSLNQTQLTRFLTDCCVIFNNCHGWTNNFYLIQLHYSQLSLVYVFVHHIFWSCDQLPGIISAKAAYPSNQSINQSINQTKRAGAHGWYARLARTAGMCGWRAWFKKESRD